VSLNTLGTIFFRLNEDMSTVDAFYFSMITLASVGYGDINILNNSSKIFNIFFVTFGVPLIGIALNKFVEVWVRIEQQKWLTKFAKRGVSKEVLQAIDLDKSVEMGRYKFLSHMLVHLGRVNVSDIDNINHLFDILDRDSSGTLDVGDIKIYMQSVKSISVMQLSSYDYRRSFD